MLELKLDLFRFKNVLKAEGPEPEFFSGGLALDATVLAGLVGGEAVSEERVEPGRSTRGVFEEGGEALG